MSRPSTSAESKPDKEAGHQLTVARSALPQIGGDQAVSSAFETLLGSPSNVSYWHEAADPGCPLFGR
jgi:hypothetical protein